MSAENDYLTTGGDDHFLPKLLQAMHRATSIDIAVAFVRQTGLELIQDELAAAVERGVSVRFLTSTYLNVTDPHALRNLMLLHETGAEVRVFQSGTQSFHMKAYIFVWVDSEGFKDGAAFVGSSNISQSALRGGLEWNLRAAPSESPRAFREIQQSFNQLYADPRAVSLTHNFVDDYFLASRPILPEQLLEPGQEEVIPPPTPTPIQEEALAALNATRESGYTRGLVVMATGLGKTWLAAFDTHAVGAKRVLFVAHRKEIIAQAEATFIRIRPEAKVGRYTGEERKLDADMLFASVQTFSKAEHLEKFARGYFDYVVIDEFHHAAARTYQRLLGYFEPAFLLGLTATPERTDNADILALCDNNLVYRKDLFDGIHAELLSPFEYYGIGDKHADYKAVPWRNGRFDAAELLNQLATQARASHALAEWRSRKQERTLAFCISKKHSDFMAKFFRDNGVKAVSVHSDSVDMGRTEALRQLEIGDIEVLFSVDLFSEGVDLPSIDTVLMLRPTESKILFLQQLGRGLRCSPDTGKEKLIVLDFIGNHISFFNKPEALFDIGVTNQERRAFVKAAEENDLALPPGCLVNYDLGAIDFMTHLTATRVDQQVEIYRSLKFSKGRRPTVSEFYLAGGNVQTVRAEYGQWFEMLKQEGDLSDAQRRCLSKSKPLFLEVEKTGMTKSFKMVLLRAMVELDSFAVPATTETLAAASYGLLRRMPRLHDDFPAAFRELGTLSEADAKKWHTYWKKHPINAWIGGNRAATEFSFFTVTDGRFVFADDLGDIDMDEFDVMIDELASYRLRQYEARLQNRASDDDAAPPVISMVSSAGIPFFADLEVACGHFRTSPHETENIERRMLPASYGALDPSLHFVARAKGDSMNGGRSPIADGDYLLLEQIDSTHAGSISNQIVAIERQDDADDDQYLLRRVEKIAQNHYKLVAANVDPQYEDIEAGPEDGLRSLARFKAVVPPEDLLLHQPMMRAEIPPVFDLEFVSAYWNTGHACPRDSGEQFLLVTLNKRGAAKDYRYEDYFIDQSTFHWQSQNSTGPTGKRGRDVINHIANRERVHLFIRKHKLLRQKAAPFVYCGTVTYASYTGANPMNVTWHLDTPLSAVLYEDFSQ